MENAWLIVGLGNPGRQYERTRHNVGFMVVDRLARNWNADWAEEPRFQCRLARVDQNDLVTRKIFLCQPLTYMNASGEAVGAVTAFYRIPPDRTLVVVDDADLGFAELRLRPKGSSGGHRGLESVESHLGTREYPRLRLGIGRGAGGGREMVGHVLSAFGADETAQLDALIRVACDQAICWLDRGVAEAMNRYNGRAIQDSGESACPGST